MGLSFPLPCTVFCPALPSTLSDLGSALQHHPSPRPVAFYLVSRGLLSVLREAQLVSVLGQLPSLFTAQVDDNGSYGIKGSEMTSSRLGKETNKTC